MRSSNKLSFVLVFISIFCLSSTLFSKNIMAFDFPVINSYVQREIYPYESITFDFITYNNQFSVETDSFIDFYLEYYFFVFYRETTFIINNTHAISLNITCSMDLDNFLSQLPEDPTIEDLILSYQYNCIYQIYSNASIDMLTFRFIKNEIFGLNPLMNYSLFFFESGQNSWSSLNTVEKNISGSSETYLESSISNLEGEKKYYFTIFDVKEEPQAPLENWIKIFLIILIPSIIIFIGIIIVVSKEEYLEYIKKKVIPINKGSHRLSLEEVLENENRNKIIELVLKNPGIHFNELLRKTELTPGSLVWHLTILETYKIIRKKPFENYVVYFPYYQTNPISNIDLKLKKSDLTLKILEIIKNKPGIWNNKITHSLKRNRKTIQYHIDKLIDLKLINKKKKGNKKCLYINSDSDFFEKKDN